MDWEVLPPKPFLSLTDRPLFVARTGHVDQFDEWHSGMSWEGEKYILESSDPQLHIKLKLVVFGTPAKKEILALNPRGRLRPYRWHARLVIEGFELEVGFGPCKTLRNALQAVGAIDLPPHVRDLLGVFYAPQGATCVFLVEDDGRMTPWATMFGRWGEYKGWPSLRRFLTVRMDEVGQRLVRMVRTSVCGYSSTTDPKVRDKAKELELWTTWIEKSKSA